MPRLYISAARQSSGKTAVSVGIAAALAARGLAPQPFKKGPDYIDSMWLAQAAGRPCINLDFHTMDRETIRATLTRYADQTQFALIEGTKGLFDGIDVEGSDSNAALAKLIEAPVVLVIDAKGMTRGVVPLLLGYTNFDPELNISGVILNNLSGARHESKIRAAIDRYLDVPVLGAIPRDTRMALTMRHLGLIPSNEADDAEQRITALRECIEAHVDLDTITTIASDAPALAAKPLDLGPHSDAPRLRIGIARDSAFGFYYPDDLERLEHAGADLVTIDTLRDPHLPDVDGLLIGGGFPETHLRALQDNASLRGEIRQAIDDGLPCYAECGGLMYLSRAITWQGERYEMAGALPGEVTMHAKPVGRGYTVLEATDDHPWYGVPGTEQPEHYPAHEFHYSSIEGLPSDTRYAFRVRRGVGVDGTHDGIVHRNLLACYCHFRDVGSNHWTSRFAAFVRRHKQNRLSQTSRTRVQG